VNSNLLRRAATVMFAAICATRPAVAAADSNYPRDLASGCANCHGTNGKSVGIVPPLAGLDRDYIVLQMQDFKRGRRPSTVMHQIAKGYSDEQIELMAEYFAAQK